MAAVEELVSAAQLPPRATGSDFRDWRRESIRHTELLSHRHPCVRGQVGIDHAVPWAVRRTREVLRIEVDIALGLVGVEHVDRSTKTALQSNRLQMPVPPAVRYEQEVSDVLVPDSVAVPLLELPVHRQRVHRQPDVGLRRELHAHTGRAPPGRAHRGSDILLQHDDAEAPRSEVPGARGTDDARADDDNVSGVGAQSVPPSTPKRCSSGIPRSKS